MQAESLEVLEKADVAPAQARAIVRAIEIELGSAKDTLATKQDVMLLRQEMAELRGELRAEIHASASSTSGRCTVRYWARWPSWDSPTSSPRTRR